MKWKQLLVEYFSFTRKDLIGIALLIIAVLIIFILPSYLPSSDTAPIPADTAWLAAIKSLEQDHLPGKTASYSRNLKPYYEPYNDNTPKGPGKLFFFDPNNLSAESWARLGLREKTIGIILHFLEKGGRFRQPSDLQKIYGLYKDEYDRLAPYIQIQSSGLDKVKQERFTSKRPPVIASFDVNNADTATFIALPGIGSKLASRIINFRDKLGGFYSVSQVAETFGLSDSTYRKILPYLKISDNNFRKLNLNTASLDELKAHPYIRFTIANAIIAYRNQHGLFQEVGDLKKLMILSEEQYNKIFPYLVTK